jgi:hypothetical protein
MKTQSILFGLIFILLISPCTIHAQDTALIRLGYYGSLVNAMILISPSESYDFGSHPPGLLTDYVAVPAGEIQVDFLAAGESVSITETVVIEEGQQYIFVKTGYDDIPLLINETQIRQDLNAAATDSIITIVGRPPAIEGYGVRYSTDDPAFSTRFALQRYEGYAAYLQDTSTVNGLVDAAVTYENSGGEAIDQEFQFYKLPATNVFFNAEAPSIISYSTNGSVLDWLQAQNAGVDSPFTFNNFHATATTGGFAAALVDCPDYMWLLWTDIAYDALTPEQQNAVSGRDASSVMDRSVLTQSLTAPWLLAPNSTTRGGTPIEFLNPFSTDAVAAPADDTLVGNVNLTISTTGSGVQNVIQVIDSVPFQEPRSFRLAVRLNF